MNQSNYKNSYDDWHNKLEVDVNATALWHKKVKEISKPEEDFLGKRVLEIGCGRGGFACWLATQKFAPIELVAADFSSSAVRIGENFSKTRNIQNIKWLEADIQNISFPEGSFDTVISCETIEHVMNPKKAVEELVRVLKPGGRLFLTTPNYFNIFGLYRCYRYVIRKPFKEAGQPINKPVLLPLTLKWVRDAGMTVEDFGSEDIVIPRFRRPPFHITLPNRFQFVSKWIGIQSFILARKPISK